MKRVVGTLIVLSALATVAIVGAAVDAPKFQVDPAWPKIPNNWQFGQVASVSVDGQDHVWVLQRPGTLSAEEWGHIVRRLGL